MLKRFSLIVFCFLNLVIISCNKEEDDLPVNIDNDVVDDSGDDNDDEGYNPNDYINYASYSVQELIDMNISLRKILEYYEVSDLYGKRYLGGYIAYYDEIDSTGFVASYENHPQYLNWNQAVQTYPSNGLWVLPNPKELYEIFQNLLPVLGEDYSIIRYWSSDQYSSSQAYAIDRIYTYSEENSIPNGFIKSKSDLYAVRPIKRFQVGQNIDDSENDSGSRPTVQQLIDLGVSISDIKDLYGYQPNEILGNKYLEGMIAYLNVGGDGKIYGGIVIALEDYPQELNWDDAMSTFPYSGWSIPSASDLDYVCSAMGSYTNLQTTWQSVYGYQKNYWTSNETASQPWNNEAVAFTFSGCNRLEGTWKTNVYSVRGVKHFN